MNRVAAQSQQSITLPALLMVALNLRPALASVGPLLEMARSSLHISHGIAALLTSLPIVCMGVFAPLAMPLRVRWGLKRTVAIMLLLMTVALLWRAQGSLFSLLSSSILVGIAIAILGPLLSSYVKQAFPKRSARVSSWLTTAICVGAALAAASSAALSEYLGWAGALSSWAGLAALAAWQWHRTVPNGMHVTAMQTTALPWSQPRAWLLLLLFGLQSMVFYCLLTWLAPAFVNFGLSIGSAGRLLAAFTLTQILGTLFVSVLTTRRVRYWALIGSAVCSLSAQLALWQAPLAAPYLWVCLLGMGVAGLFALGLILPLDYSDSPEAAGSWTAMMCGGGYLMAAGGPYLCGVLLDMTHDYSALFAAISLLSVGVLLLCMLQRPNKSATA